MMAFPAICCNEPLSLGNVSQGNHHHIDARPGLGSMSGSCCRERIAKNIVLLLSLLLYYCTILLYYIVYHNCSTTVVLFKSDNRGKLRNPRPLTQFFWHKCPMNSKDPRPSVQAAQVNRKCHEPSSCLDRDIILISFPILPSQVNPGDGRV